MTPIKVDSFIGSLCVQFSGAPVIALRTLHTAPEVLMNLGVMVEVGLSRRTGIVSPTLPLCTSMNLQITVEQCVAPAPQEHWAKEAPEGKWCLEQDQEDSTNFALIPLDLGSTRPKISKCILKL